MVAGRLRPSHGKTFKLVDLISKITAIVGQDSNIKRLTPFKRPSPSPGTGRLDPSLAAEKGQEPD
jgi:hypothetical protein